MFKDPNILALIAYLAGHAVQYLMTRTLRIPTATVAQTPFPGIINSLEDQIAPIAEAAVNAAILKQIGSSRTDSDPAPK